MRAWPTNRCGIVLRVLSSIMWTRSFRWLTHHAFLPVSQFVDAKALLQSLDLHATLETTAPLIATNFFCTPVVFHKTEADTIVDRFASLKVEYLLSIGVKHSPELTQFANSANT